MSRSMPVRPAAAFAIPALMFLAACSTPGDPAPEPGGEAVPADLIVSTNEPFWNARAEGGTVVLTGAGQPERSLAIASSQLAGDVRTISASDTTGNLVIEVRAEACQDSMSGAAFPLTGTLSFDGGEAIRGCARPASMPMPEPPE